MPEVVICKGCKKKVDVDAEEYVIPKQGTEFGFAEVTRSFNCGGSNLRVQ